MDDDGVIDSRRVMPREHDIRVIHLRVLSKSQAPYNKEYVRLIMYTRKGTVVLESGTSRHCQRPRVTLDPTNVMFAT